MLVKKQVVATFAAAFLLFAVAVASVGARTASTTVSSLLAVINATRGAQGLAPLHLDARLARAARAHSVDMLHRNYFSHGAFAARVRASGARGPVFGENLAWGTAATPQWIVTQWLASPAHRANLLRAGFRRIGIGLVTGTFGGYGGATVVTADFAGT
jgi:uncharacterized protein YkwD